MQVASLWMTPVVVNGFLYGQFSATVAGENDSGAFKCVELSALHARGVTRSQVRTQLVRDYGTRVLADTPTSGAGLAAWLAPIAILLAGLALAVALARRWQTAGPPPPAGPLDDRYDRLVDDHLRALD